MAAVALAGSSAGKGSAIGEWPYAARVTAWRPFQVRRGIGGDETRTQGAWSAALRFGAKDYPFDIAVGTTLTGIPVGYDSTLLTMMVPASVHWTEAVLVRGAFGYPNTPLDGEAVFYLKGHAYNSAVQYSQQAVDSPLSEGRWYYYTLFLCINEQGPPFPGEWNVGAVAALLVPKNYHHAERLFDMIPPFYHGYDDRQVADGHNGPMRRFVAIVGYDCDYNRTLLDGVLDVYHPDFSPLMFMQQVGANLGFPAESALGGARYRSIIGQLWDLEETRGTALGFQDFVYAASNYRCEVVDGYNSLLTADDTEFVHGIGHWQSYTNAHVVDMTNSAPTGGDPVHPPLDPYTYLVQRKYTGTDLLAPGGQGVMEVTEVPSGALKDYAIVCGLSTDGEPDDWLHLGIVVQPTEIWELQFYCCHKSGAPNATVIGSYVMFDNQGNYAGTVAGPTQNVADATAWTFYSYKKQFTQLAYVFPAIWWHAATTLVARYVSGVQMARVQASGGVAVVLQPDIYLTLMDTPGVKKIGGTQAHMGPP